MVATVVDGLANARLNHENEDEAEVVNIHAVSTIYCSVYSFAVFVRVVVAAAAAAAAPPDEDAICSVVAASAASFDSNDTVVALHSSHR